MVGVVWHGGILNISEDRAVVCGQGSERERGITDAEVSGLSKCKDGIAIVSNGKTVEGDSGVRLLMLSFSLEHRGGVKARDPGRRQEYCLCSVVYEQI